ncbi:MAG: cytochrome family [Gammaproteobacteria bacterium]|jgi:cytochrome P450|nr:cytochrome family [Gammaproteobacteria bacterium]
MNNPLPTPPGTEPPSLSIAQLDQDPHGVFRRYRHLTPLLKRENAGYIAIRAADIETLAFDPRTRQVETEQLAVRGIHSGPLFDLWSNSMLFANSAEHRRRRVPMSRAFAFKLIEELRPHIRTAALRILSEHLHHGELDFLNDFAALIPARVIAEILGIPGSDVPHFTELVYSVSRSLSLSYAREEIQGMEESARQLNEYVNGLFSTRGATLSNDFLTSYAQSVAEAGNLSAAETLSQVVTIIIAGSDTTRGAIAVQTALLLQHREQWDAVCADPTMIPGAVSESLRYEPVVGSFPRFTLEDIEIDGYVVPRNNILSLSTLSAMRDPCQYADPDRFNIRRTDHPRRHFIFGLGVHRCLGEVLARAELEESLAALVERLPQVELIGKPPTLQGHGGIRRIDGMRLGWASRR